MTDPSLYLYPYKSICCGVDSILNVCRWPFCEPCKVSDVTGIKKDSKNVFFIETSKSNDLNPRQACAVESAALQNPNLNIATLMTGLVRTAIFTFGTSNLVITFFTLRWNSGIFVQSGITGRTLFLI